MKRRELSIEVKNKIIDLHLNQGLPTFFLLGTPNKIKIYNYKLREHL